MSKKKKPKAVAKKPKGGKITRASRRPKKPAGRSGPRSQPLPGMEQVRVARLDNICEGIGEERERMNAAKVEEKGLISAALQTMQQRNVTVYRHGGVELARVPGAEKLRVRLTKEQGDAGAEDLETGGEGESPSDEEELADAASDEAVNA